MNDVKRGPAAANGFLEVIRLQERNAELSRAFDLAFHTLNQKFEKQLAAQAERIDRLEGLLNPLTVDPADPDVEWHYRRSDGILRPAPADPEERLKMIAAGVRLFPIVTRNTREDGRMAVSPPPMLVEVDDEQEGSRA